MSNQRIRILQRRQLLFLLVSIAILIFVVLSVPNLFLSMVFGLTGYYLLAPAADYLERRGLNRAIATLIPFTLVAFLIIFGLVVLIPKLTTQIAAFQKQLPEMSLAIEGLFHKFQAKLQSIAPAAVLDVSTDHIKNLLSGWGQGIFEKLPEHLSNSLTVLFLSPLLVLYFLMDGRKFIRNLLRMVPNSFFELALDLQHQLGFQFGGFIRARLLETVILTIALWIGFFAIDFPYALLLAILGAVLNLIPYLGPLISAVPAFILALVQGGDSTVLLQLTFIYVGSQVFDAVVLVPFLVGRIVNLHPLIVILSIMVGAQAMGILGMVISIPLASAIKVISQALYTHLTEIRQGSG